MKKAHWLLLLLNLFVALTYAQPQLTVTPTINSIGYRIVIPTGILQAAYSIQPQFKIANGTWRNGLAPSLITDSAIRYLAGSFFQLQAGSSYDLDFLVADSFPSINTYHLTGAVNTLAEPQLVNNSIIKYVSPNGAGNYTIASPGSLSTLMQSQHITCGTTIIFKSGIYYAGGYILNQDSDCTEPVIFLAEPGGTVYLDGSDTTTYLWTPNASDSTIFQTVANAATDFSTLCLLDGNRLYPYASVSAVLRPFSTDYYPSLENLDYGLSGFYRDNNVYYIKTINHDNPNQHQIILSNKIYFLSVYGNGKKNSIQFRNLKFRYYGRCYHDAITIFNPNPAFFNASVCTFNDASNILFDSCEFRFNSAYLAFNGACNNNVIQHCNYYDQTGLWSHAAFKQTKDDVTHYGLGASYLPEGREGRYLEYATAIFRPATGTTYQNVFRYNYVDGFISGISFTCSSDARVSEYDINNNYFTNMYDAIDVNSYSINARVWNNRVHGFMVGLSTINSDLGPIYFFRNTMTAGLDRHNEKGYDINYVDCDGSIDDKIWGLAFKLNSGDAQTFKQCDIYLMHNTIAADDSLAFNFYTFTSLWRHLYSNNNIYYSRHNNMMFDGPRGDSVFTFNSHHDNFYSEINNIALMHTIHNNSPCSYFSALKPLQDSIRVVTNALDTAQIILRSQISNPQFLDLNNDNLYLTYTSSCIDAAPVIPNISDQFYGAAPDIGAYEMMPDTSVIYNYSTQNITQQIADTLSQATHLIINDTIYGPIDTSYILTTSSTVCDEISIINGPSTITDSVTSVICCTVIQNGDSIHYTSTVNELHTTINTDTLNITCSTITTDSVFTEIAIFTSLTPVPKTEVKIYPNPASSLVTLQLAGTAQLSIINEMGQVIMEQVIAGNYNIDISNYPAGLYHFSIIQNDTAYRKNIIIAR